MDGGAIELIELYDALEHQPTSIEVHESLLALWERLGDNGNKDLSYNVIIASTIGV